MERARRAPKKAAALPSNVQRGLESLAENNVATIASMLDVQGACPNAAAVAAALADCMAVNNLSAEALLARFFDEGLLSAYCAAKIGKSGKGNAATLAARIAKEWAKPSFYPLTMAASTTSDAALPARMSSSPLMLQWPKREK